MRMAISVIRKQERPARSANAVEILTRTASVTAIRAVVNVRNASIIRWALTVRSVDQDIGATRSWNRKAIAKLVGWF